MKTYKFKIHGNNYDVAINSIEGNIANVDVNGTSYQVEMENAPVAPVRPAAVSSAPVAAPVAAPIASPVAAAPVAPAAPVAAGGKKVTAPLPGVILEINVNVGDVVKVGQQIAVLEAMKMENAIEAEFEGTVTAINANKGESVLEGTTIITIG